MKIFLTAFTLTFSLILCSCAKNPPKPYSPPADNEAVNIGNSTKTPNYSFTDGFIYHEWKGENPIFWEIPFYYRNGDIVMDKWGNRYSRSDRYKVKKIVTSKYFDIFIDITEKQGIFRKATNMTDVAYDNLIKELEKHYNHIKSIYGEPSNVDGNGKIEVVFHENSYMNGKAGYFIRENVWKSFLFSAEADVIYISSSEYMNKTSVDGKLFSSRCVDTIIHELQHDIRANYGEHRSPDRWMSEALSISTYPVIHSGSGSGRSANLTYYNSTINGKYFFDWGSIYDYENYITAANFMYWLYLHGGGDQIIKDIIFLNNHKRPDYQSIEDAVRKNISDLKGADISTIIKTWYKANFLNEPNSINGYKTKNPNIRVGQANDSSGKVVLKPYYAVYTTTDMYSQNLSLTGRGIHLENLKNSKGEEWLLIFNGNSAASIEVKINPNVRSLRSLSIEEEEEEWFDAVYYIE